MPAMEKIKTFKESGLYKTLIFYYNSIRDNFFVRTSSYFGWRILIWLITVFFSVKGLQQSILTYIQLPYFKSFEQDGASYQTNTILTQIPFSMKGVIGYISDKYPVKRYRKRYYLYSISLIGTASCVALGCLPNHIASQFPFIVHILYFLIFLQIATIDLLNEGMYSEIIKASDKNGVDIVSFVWFLSTTGSLIGALSIGLFANEEDSSQKSSFNIVSFLLAPLSLIIIFPIWRRWMPELPSIDAGLLAVAPRSPVVSQLQLPNSSFSKKKEDDTNEEWYRTRRNAEIGLEPLEEEDKKELEGGHFKIENDARERGITAIRIPKRGYNQDLLSPLELTQMQSRSSPVSLVSEDESFRGYTEGEFAISTRFRRNKGGSSPLATHAVSSPLGIGAQHGLLRHSKSDIGDDMIGMSTDRFLGANLKEKHIARSDILDHMKNNGNEYGDEDASPSSVVRWIIPKKPYVVLSPKEQSIKDEEEKEAFAKEIEHGNASRDALDEDEKTSLIQKGKLGNSVNLNSGFFRSLSKVFGKSTRRSIDCSTQYSAHPLFSHYLSIKAHFYDSMFKNEVTPLFSLHPPDLITSLTLNALSDEKEKNAISYRKTDHGERELQEEPSFIYSRSQDEREKVTSMREYERDIGSKVSDGHVYSSIHRRAVDVYEEAPLKEEKYGLCEKDYSSSLLPVESAYDPQSVLSPSASSLQHASYNFSPNSHSFHAHSPNSHQRPLPVTDTFSPKTFQTTHARRATSPNPLTSPPRGKFLHQNYFPPQVTLYREKSLTPSESLPTFRPPLCISIHSQDHSPKSPHGLQVIGSYLPSPEDVIRQRILHLAIITSLLSMLLGGNSLWTPIFLSSRSANTLNVTSAMLGAIICVFLNYRWLPRNIANINFYLFLSSATYILIPGAVDYYYTAEEACVPNGPHFTNVFYMTTTSLVGCICQLIAVVIFNVIAKKITFRSLYVSTTVIMCIAACTDLVIVNRWNKSILGVSDKYFYFFGSACILQLSAMLNYMPGILLCSKMSIRNTESSCFSLIANYSSFGAAISYIIGNFLIDAYGISTTVPCNFDSLSSLILWGHFLIPLVMIPLSYLLIPNEIIMEAQEECHRDDR